MSGFLPINTYLGKLRIVEVLDWYDGPRLFIAENASGNRYVVFWADEQEGENLWLYSPVSESRIASLVSGKLDLRSIYTASEDGVIFLVRLMNQGQANVEAIFPEQLEQDLLPPHDDFLASDEGFFPEDAPMSTEHSDTLVHQITVNRPQSNAEVAFEALASVAASWSQLVHAVLSVPPVLVGASAGSLVVKLETQAGSKLPNFLNRLRSLVALPTPEQINTHLSYQERKLLELFLESLHKNKLTLTAKIILEPDQPFLLLSHPVVRDLRLALIDLNQHIVDSVEVPQADDLSKLFRMIEFINDGEDNLGYLLSLSPRQVNYYKQAARILGLLNQRGSVTSRGQYLVGLSQTDRYAVAKVFFESSPVGLAWLLYCRVSSVSELKPETAKAFLLSQCSNLSEATVGRRAHTLRYWVTAFQEQ